jgi:ribosomal protein S18 acetylase RimI-like enzyme
MIIRRAVRSDARALSELATATYTTAFGHSLGAADLAAELEANVSAACFERYLDDDTILIAEVDGRIVGYVQFGAASVPVEEGSAADQELRRLYVHPDYQRQGIGTRLMDAVFAHPQIRTARSVYLDVWERNHDGLRFYRRRGFDVIGSHRFEVASGAPTDLDFIMVRRSSF